MAIFKKPRETEEKMNDVRELKRTVEEPMKETPEPIHENIAPVKKVETLTSIPLFVKIDRYKDLLDIMNDIKSVVFLAKNTLTIQKQIETLVDENRRLIEEAVKKIDERIAMLDTELTKPATFEKIGYDKPQRVVGEIPDKSLENVVSDLKRQIESLKLDLKNIS